MKNETDRLLTWYRQQARPFLQRHAPERVEVFNRDAIRLEKYIEVLDEELTVYFLGNSGVGKSTLINALVAGRATVVPSGGVGPLTAQAITVQYDSIPRIEVDYHGQGRLWQLVFGLESAWKAELGSPKLPEDAPEEFASPNGASIEGDDDVDVQYPEPNQERLDRIRLAEMLVIGSDSRQVAVGYVLDSLRAALGYKRIWGTAPADIDADRIERIRAALALARAGQRFSRRGNAEDLKRDLKDHASGFLAPLIRTLTVWWPSPLLATGMRLVDLPGLGIVGDPRPEITRDFMRKNARVVVLVVDKSGVTEPVAKLLRESEFLARLVHGSDDPESNPVLLVAVTRIDDVASTESLAREDTAYSLHFAEAAQKTKEMVRSQLRGELESHWTSAGYMSEAKQGVIDTLLNSLQVFPVSAPEYQKMLRGRRTDFDTPEQTNLPRMIDGLKRLKDQQKCRLQSQLQSYLENLMDGVISSIRLVEAEWAADNRHAEEMEQLRSDLACFIAPLQRRFDTLQGQYREFLRGTIPNRIADLVKSAKATARQQIALYLLTLGQEHWATLKAAVRRGGRFQGKTNIDLQREFALRFEEPIAETWGTHILKDIRKRTNEYATDCTELVDQVAEWARQQGTRVQQDMVETQLKQIKFDAARLNAVGREMIEEIREQNASRLIEAIDGPIRERCRVFVESAEASGTGVRNRILQLFAELAGKVTEAAEPPAIEILRNLFKGVEEEILNTLDSQRDPLPSISSAVVTSQEKYLLRSDGQRRKRILEEAGAVLGGSPVPATFGVGAS